jgi:hypothetical protein
MTSPPPLNKTRLLPLREQPELWRGLTVSALIGMVVVHAIGTLAVRGVYLRFALFVEVPLVALALWVATGARWAAPGATVITTLLVAYTAVRSRSRLAELEGGEILAAVLFFGLGLVVVVAGVATTVYSRRAT